MSAVVTPFRRPPSPRIELEDSEQVPSTSTRGPIFAIALTIALGVGATFAWSMTARISSGAVAEGHIVVENSRRTIQHLEGGIVGEILVKDGDRVKAGQVVIRLDDARARLSYDLLRDKLDQNRAFTAHLRAERDRLAAPAFPKDLVERAATEPATANILDQQVRQFEARRASQAGEVAILKNKIGQYKQQIAGQEAQVKSKAAQLHLIDDELDGVKSLYAEGLSLKTRVLALEREAADLNGSQAEIQSQIATTEVAISETEMQILQTDRSAQEDVIEKLRQADADRFDIEDRLAVQTEMMKRLEVRSPIDGQVVGLEVHTLGGVISPGQKLMDIVPLTERLLVEVAIPPSEISHIKSGMQAEVRLAALRQRTTPTLQGTVTTVSSDVLPDPNTRQPYYVARVEIPQSQLFQLGEQRLVAGMPAEVLVKNGERTVLRYVMAPLSDAIFQSFRQD